MKTIKKYITHLSIIICSGIIAILFSLTEPGYEIELKTVDYRFLLKGESVPSPEIALVLIDEQSRERLGEAPYRRDIFATLINGLNKMGARVIAVDFRFEAPKEKEKESDSLLCAAVENSKNVITGCYFRSIDTTKIKSTSIKDFKNLSNTLFLISDEKAPVFQDLVQAGVHIGHVNVLTNEPTGSACRIPLYIKYKEELCAAFSLETIKNFLEITDRDIKTTNNKLVLMPGGREPIHIPMNENGGYLINYFGFEKAFENYYSCVEIFDYCKKIINKEANGSYDAKFKNKIVLIGTLVEDYDKFTTPFSVEFPGVLIHATIVDNILQEQFIRQFPFFNVISFILIGMLLLIIFVHTKPLFQIAGSLTLLIGYGVGSYLLFKFFLILVPFILPLFFIALSATVSGIYQYTTALKLNASLESKVQQLDQMVKLLDAKGEVISPATSYYRFIIFPIEEREVCIFPHWLELRSVGPPHEPTFQPGLPVKNPLHVDLHTIKKLSFDFKKVWEIYFEYIQAGKTDGIKPLDQLKKIGELMVKSFGLKGTFNSLFHTHNKSVPLNLVIMDYKIPWHFAYNMKNERFLCEEYAIGISFTSEKDIYSQNSLQQVKGDAHGAEDKMGVLFYGDWHKHSFKKLKYVYKQIAYLENKLNHKGYSVNVVSEKINVFLNLLEGVVSNSNNLRLIHYSGHAREGYLDIGENDFLKPGMITENLGITLPSRPLIFLNACSSGRLPQNWDKINNLATEFLACGAAACIVTCFDIYEQTATIFSNIFYDYFIDQQFEAGYALKQTIRDLSKIDRKSNYDPEYDITRYAYCLYGDPTVKF